MATGFFKISTADPSIHTLALDHFTGKKFISFAVLVAKDNVAAFCQVLRFEVIDQLLFALCKIGFISKMFGFNNIFMI